MSHSPSGLRLAVDIGGTFTDIAVFDATTGRLRFGKVLTTPQRLVDGINAGVEKAGPDYAETGLFLHGSTIAINTMLERTGAKTALVITQGFRDVYEIGRINRPDAYNLYFQKHRPVIARGRKLAKLGVEAVAILFLNSYVNPAHEQRAKALLEAKHPDLFVSASHELSQEYREFERCSTVAANAYIGPRVRRYLAEIDEHIRAAGFRGSFLVVQSTGGALRGGGG